MNTATIARLIDVSGDTVRRWCASDEYGAYLSPGATPPANVERAFNAHDLKILNYVATQRAGGIQHDQIKAALSKMQTDNYEALPDVPQQWKTVDQSGMIAVNEASEQASQLAELGALQVVVQGLRERLSEVTERAETLQRELDHLKATDQTSQTQIHSLELELNTARGEVEALKARLSTYSLTGDRPIPLVVLVGVTALAVLLAVLITLVVVRLVL